MLQGRKVIFSGIKPTSTPTLGNYLGAIKNWLSLQNEYNCLYSVVDLHSLTVRNDPAELRKRAREVIALYIACGLDPKENTLYYQSHVPAHSELTWILNCYTYMGELSRMTQYKEKSQKQSENINSGLFNYPVLMAADILLFQTDLVPVGDDQKQHVELARDVAVRFNNLYGSVFTVPEVYLPKTGARIMDLQDPTKKMSKTEDNENGVIYLLDDPTRIAGKIKKSVTDTGSEVKYSQDKPGISNLLDIYSVATGKPIADCEKEFRGSGYGNFKQAVADAVVACIEPVQSEFKKLWIEKDYLDSVIKEGAERAQSMAYRTLEKVRKKVGLPEKI